MSIFMGLTARAPSRRQTGGILPVDPRDGSGGRGFFLASPVQPAGPCRLPVAERYGASAELLPVDAEHRQRYRERLRLDAWKRYLNSPKQFPVLEHDLVLKLWHLDALHGAVGQFDGDCVGRRRYVDGRCQWMARAVVPEQAISSYADVNKQRGIFQLQGCGDRLVCHSHVDGYPWILGLLDHDPW